MTPEDSTTELESILRKKIPDVPQPLRANVTAAVEERLKRQTFVDDMKWLGFCCGILLLAIGCQWLVFKTSSDRLVEFSNTELASSQPNPINPSALMPSINKTNTRF